MLGVRPLSLFFFLFLGLIGVRRYAADVRRGGLLHCWDYLVLLLNTSYRHDQHD